MEIYIKIFEVYNKLKENLFLLIQLSIIIIFKMCIKIF